MKHIFGLLFSSFQFAGVLQTKLKDNYIRNMDKLKVYAVRNIFIPSPNSSSSSSSSSFAVSTFSPDGITPSSARLATARERYLQLKREHDALIWEKRETETLFKDIRSSLFSLRFAAQKFDEVNISPVADHVTQLAQYQERLHSLQNEAQGTHHYCLLCESYCTYVILMHIVRTIQHY